MILILSDTNDVHANYVEAIINKRGLDYQRLNLDVNALLETKVSFSNSNWEIVQKGTSIYLSKVKSVWNRRTFVELLLDEIYDQTAQFKLWKNEWNKTLLGIYSSIRHVPWLNPWRKAYQAENKYLQMELAVKCGFSIPETIVSNNKEELIQFAKANKDRVALKLMHQDFYKNDAGEFQGLYVNLIDSDALNQFNQTGENPIVLQKYVDKLFEVRYTVIGDSHFVCKIESQKSSQANIDWRRYDIPHTPHLQIHPPDKIREQVSKLMKALEIEYGALDFIVDENENWHFLEVNAMGQYLWIEELADLKISDGIVDWLEKARFEF